MIEGDVVGRDVVGDCDGVTVGASVLYSAQKNKNEMQADYSKRKIGKVI